MNFLYKFFLIAIMLVSIAFPAPMEPAKSILFILLDGMAPKSHGLYEKYCVDFNYESSDSWGKTGLAKFLHEYSGQKKPLVRNGGNCNTDFKETILIVLILCSIQNVGTARDS